MSISESGIPGMVIRALVVGVVTIEPVAFWVAAGLPLAYPPALAALQYGALDPIGVVGVVLVHGLAVLFGHRHEPTRFGHDRSR